MSLINRNPQRKTAVFSLPGHHGSLCSITWKHFYKYCQKWFCIHFIKLFRLNHTGKPILVAGTCLKQAVDLSRVASITSITRCSDLLISGREHLLWCSAGNGAAFFLQFDLDALTRHTFNWLKISKLLKAPCRYLPNLTCTALINNFILTLDQMTMCKAKNITQRYKPAELLICFHGL